MNLSLKTKKMRNSDHFWMLFINPIAKALDDTNDYKAEILDKTNKIHAKHIKK